MPARRALRAPRWAVAAAQLRPRTVRLRLTVIYGGLFLLCGAGLLAITYALVEHSTGNILTYTSKNSGFAAINTAAGALGGQHHSITIKQEGTGGTKPLTHAQAAAQAERMLALAKQQHTDMLHSLLLDSGIALAATALLSIALGWIVAGRVLRPLRAMTSAVRDISATNLHRRLAVSGPRDELTTLGETFNDLLGRLETAFQAQRQFVANASHELRTPLARQRAIGQVALADPDANVASLRTAHQRILAAGAQQERLITALLTLARGQSGVLHREPVELDELTEQVIAARADKAEKRGIRIDTMLDTAPVFGDPRLIETLAANLVENAILHNIDNGHVTISTKTTGAHTVLRVINTGPAVPPDEVTRLLEPFHRLTAARGAHGDGLGIGLSVVQAIAEAHHARLEVQARPEGGLAVEIAFKAARSDIAPTSDLDTEAEVVNIASAARSIPEGELITTRRGS